MARENEKGGDRKSRGSAQNSRSKDTKKSGWSKPDGTPLRKRKGDYFPDKEIDKRKPANRAKYAKSDGSDRSYRDSDKPREYKRPEGEERKRDYDKPREYKRPEGEERKRDYDKPREYKRPEGDERKRDYDKPREFKNSDRTERKRDFDKPREFKSGDRSERKRDFDKPRDFKKPNDRFQDREEGSKREFSRSEGDERTSESRSGEFKKAGSNYKDYKKSGYSRDRDDKPREYVKRDAGGDEKESFKPRDLSKPAFERKGKKPFEKKRERYADKDHSKEMKGRFDKDKFKSKPKRNTAGPHRERKKDTDSTSNEAIRLNRYIANAGICSRREADDLISAGLVSINGEVVTELGTKVNPGDVVKFNQETLKTEKMVYVLLNKPKDFLTTTDDPEDRKTVMTLVKDACKERIFPVGRLDRNTTGLLLLTNDGELTKRLTHPSGNIKKLYQVELDKNLTQADMVKAAEGVELEDGTVGFDEIQYASPDDKSIIGVELHSGKNRIVRRIFEELGYEVRKLDRTIFAGLTKKDLPRGRWRFLTEMELNMLKMLTGKKK